MESDCAAREAPRSPPGEPTVDGIVAKLKRKRADGVEGGRKRKRESRAGDAATPTVIEGRDRRDRREKKDRKDRKDRKEKKKKLRKLKKLEESEKSRTEIEAPEEPPQHPPDDALSKHKSIREKLSKVKIRALRPPADTPADAPADAPAIAAVGLQPLPQPAPTPAPKHAAAAALAAALPPWLAAPTTVAPTASLPFAAIPQLAPRLLARLAALNLTHAFAVQSAVIPLLLSPSPSGDVLISAATGSGKTLAYVLPIIHSLSTRVVTRLRAVIVVPTRELVSQVFTTASSLAVGTGLKIATAVGNRALAAEQTLLVGADDDDSGVSKVDILVTTPGRLVEHIKNTKGFSLAAVRWLVIDEADRLLAQSFQEWVDVVVGAVETNEDYGDLTTALENLGLRARGVRKELRKVVLSATMTRDAGKLAGLRLRRPTMVVVESAGKTNPEEHDDDNDDGSLDEVFSVPMELREYAVPIENIEYKPLYLMYLLRDRGINNGTVVFVKSNEGAARLARLIDTVVEGVDGLSWITGLITGEMEKKRRDKVLKSFKRGEVHM